MAGQKNQKEPWQEIYEEEDKQNREKFYKSIRDVKYRHDDERKEPNNRRIFALPRREAYLLPYFDERYLLGVPYLRATLWADDSCGKDKKRIEEFFFDDRSYELEITSNGFRTIEKSDENLARIIFYAKQRSAYAFYSWLYMFLRKRFFLSKLVADLVICFSVWFEVRDDNSAEERWGNFSGNKKQKDRERCISFDSPLFLLYSRAPIELREICDSQAFHIYTPLCLGGLEGTRAKFYNHAKKRNVALEYCTVENPEQKKAHGSFRRIVLKKVYPSPKSRVMFTSMAMTGLTFRFGGLLFW